MPLEAQVTEMRPVSLEFSFDYGAPLPPNVVYDSPTLEYGDAVFFSVVDQLTVDVGWRVPSPDALVSSGDLSVSVVVESGAGWQRTLVTAPVTTFTERSASTSVLIDFPAALALAAEIDSIVGASGPLVLRVQAAVEVKGAISRPGQNPVALAEVSTSDLVFDLTPSAATLRDTNPARGPSGGSSGSGAANGVAETSTATGMLSTKPGVHPVVQMVPTTVAVPNSISLAVVDVEVDVVRYAATALAAVCAFVGASGLVVSRRSRRNGEAAYIRARYGARLVPLRSMPDLGANPPFELTNFDALLAVAAQLGLPVLVDESGDSTSYYVADSLSTFVYTASGTARTRAEERRFRKRERRLAHLAERERSEQQMRNKVEAKWARHDAAEQARREKERSEWAVVDREIERKRAQLDDPASLQD